MKKLIQNWPSMVVSGVVSLIIILSTQAFSDSKEAKKEISKELNLKADIEYVNQQDNLVRREIQSSKENQQLIIDMITEFRRESQQNFIEIRKQLYKK